MPSTASSSVFREAGLKPSAFLACYGLAETTLGRHVCRAMEDELKVDPLEVESEADRRRMRPELYRLERRIPVVVVRTPSPPPSTSRSSVEDGKPLPEGQVGEVFVEGPSVTDGYWDDEEATSRVFVDGGVKTGDLGYMSEAASST